MSILNLQQWHCPGCAEKINFSGAKSSIIFLFYIKKSNHLRDKNHATVLPYTVGPAFKGHLWEQDRCPLNRAWVGYKD